MKKRGISAIVATVLIILLTVAAVSIVWGVVLPLVRNSLGEATVCSDVATSLSVKENSLTCQNGVNVSVQVARGSSVFDLVELGIHFSAEGNSYTKIASNSGFQGKGLPDSNEVRTYTFTKGVGSDERFVDLGPVDVSDISSVSVSAVVLNDDGERVRCSIDRKVDVVPSCPSS